MASEDPGRSGLERPRAAGAERLGGWAVCACALVITAYYFWTASSSGNPFIFDARNDDYYNQLVDGLLSGRLSLPLAPDPGLAALADPYDAVANRRYRLPRQTHDLSFFDGRFYLYFGITPAVALFAPARLFGARLPENLAAALLFTGAFVAALAILEACLGQLRPRPPLALRMLAATALGFGSFAPFLLRRPAVYEVAVGGGYCFAMWGAYALIRGLLGRPRRARFAAAGTFGGLAVGARPTQLVPLAAGALIASRIKGARAAALAPAALLLALLAVYNYARFGSFAEFGIRYQLAEQNQRREALFSLDFLGPGLWLNLFQPPRLQPEFPFFSLDPTPLPPMPTGHFTVEPIAGLLACAPIAALAAAWPWLLARRRRLGADARIALIGSGFAALGALTAALVALYAAVSVRYVVDFAPWLLLAGLLAWAELDGLLAAPARRALQLAAACSIAYTAALNAAIGMTGYYDWMKRANPELHRRLEDLGLPLQRLWLASRPEIAGPMRLVLSLPREERTNWQTLLAAGGRYRHDVVCIRRLGRERVRLRFHHRGFEPVDSAALQVAPDGPLSIEVAMGSLYPVNERVLGRLFPERNVTPRARGLLVRVDGRPVLSGEYDFVPSPPRLVNTGSDAILNGQCDERFGGEILEVSRVRLREALAVEPRELGGALLAR